MFFSPAAAWIAFLLTHCSQPAYSAEPNVILITLDGVRWNEVFYGSDRALDSKWMTRKHFGSALPTFWDRFVDDFHLFGNLSAGDEMRVGNAYAVSLPGYESIFLGKNVGCTSNNCKRPKREALAERLRRELKLERSEVASFASWPTIALAIESQEGSTTCNVSGTPFVDPDFPRDPALSELAQREALETAPWNYRYDRQTWAIARRYLELHKPRYLYIGLGDTDEFAHKGEYEHYFSSLNLFDAWLTELLDWLDAAGEYGKNTSVIITTDHGRGEGWNFRRHNYGTRNAERVWLFARTPSTRGHGSVRGAAGPYSQLNIRPTVEALFGLTPCPDCHSPIRELIE